MDTSNKNNISKDAEEDLNFHYIYYLNVLYKEAVTEVHVTLMRTFYYDDISTLRALLQTTLNNND